MAIQNLRSSSAHKRPIPNVLSAGQIAVNTNQASPGLFFKDSNGDLVKVGPVHIGTSAPNSSPATTAADALVSGTVYQILTLGNTDFTAVGASANTVGVVFTATGAGTGTGTVSGQQGNEKGEQWLDTTGGTYVLKIYDGTAWRSESGTFVDVSGDTMTGALGVVAGSESAPGVFFSGDTNTGLLAPAADSVAITTGGTQRIVVDSSGRVGIGDTAPGAPLTVQSDTSANNTRLIGRSTGNRSDIQFYQNNGTSFMGSLSCQDDSMNIFLASSSGDLKYTASQHTFRDENGLSVAKIDSSGNVGIGTSSPSSALDVSGAISLGSVALPSAGTARIYSRNTDNSLYLQTSSGNRISLLDGSQNSMATFEPTVLKFFISNTPQMLIDSSGNVGIGTTSPTSKLHVDGSATFAGNVSANDGITVDGGSTLSTGIYYRDDSNSYGLALYSGGSAQTNRKVFIKTDGSASFNGNVTSKATFLNELQSGYSATGSAYKAFFGSSTFVDILNNGTATFASEVVAGVRDTQGVFMTSGGALESFVSGSRVYSLTSNGGATFASNVGIGTASPEEILHVAAASEAVNSRDGVMFQSSSSLAADTGLPLVFTSHIGNVANYGVASIAGRKENATSGNAAGYLQFATGSSGGAISEKMRIDSYGRLLVNHTADTAPSGYASKLQLCDTSYQGSSLLIRRDQNNASAPALLFTKTRSSTKGGNTIVQNGDLTGQILFFAGDGNDANGLTAYIASAVDGTPGSNDMPGRLTFHTTADGATASTERLRIRQDGQTYLTNCSDFYPFSDNSTGLGAAVNRWTAVYAVNGTIQTSDSRQKTSVVDAQLGANFIKALRPVSYKWIEGGKRHTGEYDENNNWVYETVPGQRTHWGFIAQEVKQAVDAAGVDFGGWVLTDKDNPDSEQALRYDQFIAPLTKALQEAIAKIETLEQRLSDAGIA